MYTRCPSCRAQISFELPQSADSFPEGYKHKIKCPSCGVTIGVKIPRVDTTATVQPTYTPANPAASNFEPTYQTATPAPATTKADKKAERKARAAEKKSGLGRNICMMIFSLLFVALAVVGYFVSTEKFEAPEWMAGIDCFDGITPWATLIKDFDTIKASFSNSIPGTILYLLPMVLFTLAGINFIVALISAFGKKYGRAWNLIASLIVAALAVLILFSELLVTPEIKFVEYFKLLIELKAYFLFGGAALGVLQLLFALFFLKSLKRKTV